MKFVDKAGTVNVYSQFGEDALTSLALETIGVERGFTVEFGAGDGLELSNTAQFWRDRGWDALLIEPAEDRYEGLVRHTDGFGGVSISNLPVEPTGRRCIDDFVDGRDVDLMSIDVDDCEYQILREMVTRPKLILIEFNYTAPHHVEFVGGIGSRLQSSPLALFNLAKQKGYGLLSISGCNLLLVRDDLEHHFQQFDRDYWNLVDRNASTFVVTDWLGQYIFVGPKPHGMSQPYAEPNWEIAP